MMRLTMKMLAMALVAVFALATMAEAAPKKVIHHRAKHSTRVASGTTATRKKAAAKKRAAARKRAGARKTSAAKRRPTTKPR